MSLNFLTAVGQWFLQKKKYKVFLGEIHRLLLMLLLFAIKSIELTLIFSWKDKHRFHVNDHHFMFVNM